MPGCSVFVAGKRFSDPDREAGIVPGIAGPLQETRFNIKPHLGFVIVLSEKGLLIRFFQIDEGITVQGNFIILDTIPEGGGLFVLEIVLRLIEFLFDS